MAARERCSSRSTNYWDEWDELERAGELPPALFLRRKDSPFVSLFRNISKYLLLFFPD